MPGAWVPFGPVSDEFAGEMGLGLGFSLRLDLPAASSDVSFNWPIAGTLHEEYLSLRGEAVYDDVGDRIISEDLIPFSKGQVGRCYRT